MKRASYRDAIDCIAQNDDPLEQDPDKVEGYTTVQLVSWIFAVEASRVARDVVRRRKQLA